MAVFGWFFSLYPCCYVFEKQACLGWTLGEGVKNIFKKIKNNIQKRWCQRLAVLSLYGTHFQSKSMVWFPWMVTLSWNGNMDVWLRWISIFRYFLLFLAHEDTWNCILVDECILLFKQEWCKLVAICHWMPKETLIYDDLI